MAELQHTLVTKEGLENYRKNWMNFVQRRAAR